MQSALKFLIIFGLVLWAFLLFGQSTLQGMMGHRPSSNIENANTSSRCVKYGADVEGERAMDYRDRIRQLVNGCW